MLWSVIFIIFAVCLVIGPIMLMQPSARDRHLADLRQAAAQNGLQVRMVKYRDRSVAVYCQLSPALSASLDWQLVREEYEHAIHFYKDWQFQNESYVFDEKHVSSVKSLLAALPDDIVGVEVKQQVLGFWWLEKPNTSNVEDLKRWFDQLTQAVS